jgi:hypothetical protein
VLFEFDEAIARIPRWILLLAVAGTALAGVLAGLGAAGGFLVGALAAWLNFRVIERAANRLAHLAREEGEKAGGGTGAWVFIQFTGLILAALAILLVSGFSKSAAFCGLLIAPAAVVVEVVYELVTLRH